MCVCTCPVSLAVLDHSATSSCPFALCFERPSILTYAFSETTVTAEGGGGVY